MRHGLTANTVIGALEDAEDYKGFEAAITADYDAQSAVERELVLRLASILWRLRRAATMETGLFEIQARQLRDYREDCFRILAMLLRLCSAIVSLALRRRPWVMLRGKRYCRVKAAADPIEFARCFLRLANLPNFALDRLSRYEATLWHQVGRILYAIETLDRCKPRERNGRSTIVSKMDFVD